jgi:small Trp-rich protein
MYFLGLGIILLLWRLYEVGPPTIWVMTDWLIVLTPFALAAVWWWIADATGYTKRKQVEKMQKITQDRIDKHKKAIGMKVGPRK